MPTFSQYQAGSRQPVLNTGEKVSQFKTQERTSPAQCPSSKQARREVAATESVSGCVFDPNCAEHMHACKQGKTGECSAGQNRFLAPCWPEGAAAAQPRHRA
jgi:hypothetical protein